MRKFITRVLATLPAAAIGVAAFAAAPASFAATPTAASISAGGAVFVQTDDLDHNSVVAFTRDDDGQLHRVGEVRTGGRGGVERDVPLDSLASQDSLTYDEAHHLLFAVNAGSNTVTSFRVDGAHLSRLQTVASGGVFPVSVAAGHGRLFVLNAGGVGQCHGLSDHRGGTPGSASGWLAGPGSGERGRAPSSSPRLPTLRRLPTASTSW